jgi:uncharacterized membrane protein (UPF0127 family)
MAPRRLLILLLLVLVAAAAVVLAIGSITGCREMSTGPDLEVVTIEGTDFKLEVSADMPSRTRGLMDRTSIPADGGMLFIFPDAAHRSFWMKDCVVDMDLIFLDPRGRVTATHEMTVQPPQAPGETEAAYEWRVHQAACRSGFPAQFAIELQAGSIERLGVKVDDKIELDLTRLKAMAR